MENKSSFGIIGMGVMGKNLALNLASAGVPVAIYNRHVAGLEENISENIAKEHADLQLLPFDDFEKFIAALQPSRKILLMIKAGPAVDAVLNELLPLLQQGDVVMDGGNSHFDDTKIRVKEAKSKNIYFLGVGISGGEEGARKGPSIMPGGPAKGYEKVSAELESMAAKDKNGNPCCTYIGPDGAGHFVKMVHNGIEYAEMQALAEVYYLLRFYIKNDPEAIADILSQWKNDGLGSFLLEITIDILRKKEDGELLLDKILDAAEHKGTGSWSSEAALKLGVPLNTISDAVAARYISALKSTRVKAAEIYHQYKTVVSPSPEFVDHLKSSYQSAQIINHHIGFELMKSASKEWDWELNISEIARIWTNGCIIRSHLMEQLKDILKVEENILLHPKISNFIGENINDYQNTVAESLQQGFPIPVMSAALNYFLQYTTAESSACLIQAQRDYFGAHTFRRKDRASDEYFHVEWVEK